MNADYITHYGTDLSAVNAALSRHRVVEAYHMGYKVTDEGVAISHKGNLLKISTGENKRYPTFGVTLNGVFRTLPLHWLAAYCFFGNKFLSAECVRHLNGDVLNISRANIAIGSFSDNEKDKPAEIRKQAAIKARASQSKRPSNAKLSDEQVNEVLSFYNALNGKRAANGAVAELSSKLGVSRTVLCKIKNGEYYAS